MQWHGMTMTPMFSSMTMPSYDYTYISYMTNIFCFIPPSSLFGNMCKTELYFRPKYLFFLKVHKNNCCIIHLKNNTLLHSIAYELESIC
jgi:hypothetical protein